MAPYKGLIDVHGNPLKVERRNRSRASGPRAVYDAAQTTTENERHWANADSLSATASNSPDVRKKLRDRARYECRNNGYFKGLVEKLGNDLVGTGPRPQIRLPGGNKEAAKTIERVWRSWARDRRVFLADKLRILHESRVRDGECFGLLRTNPGVRHAVQLDLGLIETDQCCTPDLAWDSRQQVDGIKQDGFGNPTGYDFLRQHPGDLIWSAGWAKYDTVSADFVVHWVRASRAGQARGVPEITPGLPLAAQLRRYSLAVLSAAEWAACVSAVLTSANSVYGPDADPQAVTEATMEVLEMVRGALLAPNAGQDVKQLKAEQPTTTFPQFTDKILNEVGAGVNAPFNVISGNSSGYNYSSGRLDHILYQAAMWVERNRMEILVLGPVFIEWVNEAGYAGAIPAALPPVEEWDVSWNWDGFGSIDPNKDAQAATARLNAGLTTYATEFAAIGMDWEEQFEQQAREMERARELGLTLAYGPTPAAPAATTKPVEDDEEEPAAAYGGSSRA